MTQREGEVDAVELYRPKIQLYCLLEAVLL